VENSKPDWWKTRSLIGGRLAEARVVEGRCGGLKRGGAIEGEGVARQAVRKGWEGNSGLVWARLFFCSFLVILGFELTLGRQPVPTKAWSGVDVMKDWSVKNLGEAT
jgi:hypothetical protein